MLLRASVICAAGGIVLTAHASPPGPPSMRVGSPTAAGSVALAHQASATDAEVASTRAPVDGAWAPGGVPSGSALADAGAPQEAPGAVADLFRTSDRCIACHKGITTSEGLDVSIGFDWRASMMANSARDPYWQAAVRRELTDYPEASAAIEDECSRCHMPMASVVSRAGGGMGSVFANLPIGAGDPVTGPLAADGVSCAACHQITPEGLGTEASFTGGFHVELDVPAGGRPMYGPFEPDSGGVGIMRSATGFQPTIAPHVQTSELCAGCHTLFTHAILPGGSEGPEFPEQVPYLEWQASAYAAEEVDCQDCHMPLVGEEVPVTGVLGRARPDVSRHVFRGGNFFMQRMLNRYRDELGVVALPQELALGADRTEAHLREATVALTIAGSELRDGRLVSDVDVRNLAGHKFPTAYPSRRAWLHVTVADAGGRIVFESGAFGPDGSIAGNDNDRDPARFEPHYAEISRPDEVQIYEGVMADGGGDVTTGLLTAQRWLKENRLLPRGFDAARGGGRVAVRGAATQDPDFAAGGDRVRYDVPVDSGAGPFTVRAELWFQPIAYRWAENLAEYETFETQRFVRYYREMAPGSALPLAAASATVRE